MQKLFLKFVGLHSFLIGLFPFFIPVFLWKKGFSIAQISAFISMTGLGFVGGLILFDRARAWGFRKTVFASFLVETILISIVFFVERSWFLPVCGVLNGIYNCLFWTIQRMIFLDKMPRDGAGRDFGNFQIFVFVILKIGIFTGAFLLENGGFPAVFYLSAGTGLGGIVLFSLGKDVNRFPADFRNLPAIRFSEVLTFSDREHSRGVFFLDGPFLYLESYFWTISLFLIVKESFLNLGMVVIVLAVLFGVAFWVLKNRIDRISPQRIYVIATILYSISWGLRGVVVEIASIRILATAILILTFFNSFFRLAFNKRFFETAKDTSGYRYLFMKSYFSQFAIAVVFGGLAVAFHAFGGRMPFEEIYYGAGFLALLYGCYGRKDSST